MTKGWMGRQGGRMRKQGSWLSQLILQPPATNFPIVRVGLIVRRFTDTIGASIYCSCTSGVIRLDSPRYFAASIPDFLETDNERILGVLISAGQKQGFTTHLHSQTASWEEQIVILKQSLSFLKERNDCGIVLEYPIPRRGKRIDTVLTTPAGLIVLEFKVGAETYNKSDVDQVEDYCLELADFHTASNGVDLWPVVVATEAPNTSFVREKAQGYFWRTNHANKNLIRDQIEAILSSDNTPESG